MYKGIQLATYSIALGSTRHQISQSQKILFPAEQWTPEPNGDDVFGKDEYNYACRRGQYKPTHRWTTLKDWQFSIDRFRDDARDSSPEPAAKKR
ncbi:hypothetical protein KDK_16550 [Dictyobacter kobayashii]|uniref:Uncharacterized protein n=1 Tax=Dictyobacter kobayashii TaxID=2014872 RepID=A0A402AFJ7_9CHLR|nr:hypothetical protein KDK_16550 [Dictyobacter kobayashii]